MSKDMEESIIKAIKGEAVYYSEIMEEVEENSLDFSTVDFSDTF